MDILVGWNPSVAGIDFLARDKSNGDRSIVAVDLLRIEFEKICVIETDWSKIYWKSYIFLFFFVFSTRDIFEQLFNPVKMYTTSSFLVDLRVEVR